MEEKNKDLVYEIGYHIMPTVQESDLPGEVAKIQSVISENGGNIISEGFPVSHPLAFSIRKHMEARYLSFDKAYFGWIKFTLDSSKITLVQNKLDQNSSVLRSLITKTVKENTLYTPKVFLRKDFEKPESKVDGTPEEKVEEKVEISEEAIDKSIDELLV